jgi:DHA1 family multidrug resistance protein-like MFS transporter
MFEGIGVEWGMTFLGCIALLFVPMPFVLYKYGKSIRARSKFAPAPDIAQDKRRDEESRAQAQAEAEHQEVEKEKVEEGSGGSASGENANRVVGEKKEV